MHVSCMLCSVLAGLLFVAMIPLALVILTLKQFDEAASKTLKECMRQLPRFTVGRAQRDHVKGILNFTKAFLNEMLASRAPVMSRGCMIFF